MIKLNNPLTLNETWESWKVEGVGLYAELDCADADPVTNTFKSINGFYIVTDEDEESRTYFYLSTNWQSFFNEDGDLIRPQFLTSCDILARCPSDAKMYILRVDEENKTVFIKDLNYKGVAPCICD